MPRPHKLRPKLRGQQRFSCFFFLAAAEIKSHKRMNILLNKQTKNTFYITYTPHVPHKSRSSCRHGDSRRQTQTQSLTWFCLSMQCNCCAPVPPPPPPPSSPAYLQPAGVAVACSSNLKSAICNTISAQQRKNEVIGKWLSNGEEGAQAVATVPAI